MSPPDKLPHEEAEAIIELVVGLVEPNKISTSWNHINHVFQPLPRCVSRALMLQPLLETATRGNS